MAIGKYPRFHKGDWVEVVHPNHPYYGRLGQVVLGSKVSCEARFAEINGSFTQKPFMNRYLAKHDPTKINIGDSVRVSNAGCPYYSRQGVVKHLVAGGKLTLIAFGGTYQDEAGKEHQLLTQIPLSDLTRLEPASSTGGATLPAQG